MSVKRLIVKTLLLAALGAGAANYLVYVRTGQAPLARLRATANQFWVKGAGHLPSVPKVAELPQILQNAAPAKITPAYKWVDKKGVVHYSDVAPAQGESAQLIQVNSDTNLIQGQPKSEPAAPQAKTTSEPRVQTQTSDSTLNTSNFQNALQQAKEVSEVMRAREKNIDTAIEQRR